MRPRRLSLKGFSVMTLKSVTGLMTLPTLIAISQTPADLGATGDGVVSAMPSPDLMWAPPAGCPCRAAHPAAGSRREPAAPTAQRGERPQRGVGERWRRRRAEIERRGKPGGECRRRAPTARPRDGATKIDQVHRSANSSSSSPPAMCSHCSVRGVTPARCQRLLGFSGSRSTASRPSARASDVRSRRPRRLPRQHGAASPTTGGRSRSTPRERPKRAPAGRAPTARPSASRRRHGAGREAGMGGGAKAMISLPQCINRTTSGRRSPPLVRNRSSPSTL